LGHHRIGYISDPLENPFNFTSSRDRYLGYRQALEAAGILFRPEYHLQGEHGRYEARRLAQAMLALPEPPTAIFAANDQSALGVYQAAAGLGVRIPEDCSLLGFDNIPEARHAGLTTVDQFLEQMGYIAVQMLTRLIDREPLEDHVYRMPTELVIRASCQPPPGLASPLPPAQAGTNGSPGDRT
jgi:DNA-binding LacI/PurR family transcriptional regulator